MRGLPVRSLLSRWVRRLACAGTVGGVALLLGGGAVRAQYVDGRGLAMLHPPRVLGHWVGVLPARCGNTRAPADVELTLWAGTGLRPEGTYRLAETCRVPGLVPRISRGPWVRLRGTDVLQLTRDGQLDTQSFLQLADGALRPLDRDLEPIWGEVLSPVE